MYRALTIRGAANIPKQTWPGHVSRHLREYTTITMSAALLSIATEHRCDLLVMGGYNHDHA